MIAPPDLEAVDRIVADLGSTPSALIPILHAIQEHYGYLPAAALRRLHETTAITAAAITGVSTFYDHFELEPSGQHRISVCHGTACHVKGAELITDAFGRQLQLAPGQHTDDRGLFTLGKVACLGCCTLAPAVRIGDATYGNVSADTVERVVGHFLSRERRKEVRAADPGTAARRAQVEFRIGLDSCCVAAGTADVHRALQDELRRARADAVIKQVGCVGMCHQVPMLEVVEPGREPRLYAKVSAQDVRGIVRHHFPPAGVLGRLRSFLSRNIDDLLTDENWPGVERHVLEVRDRPVADFLGRQRRIATEHSTELDPLDVDGYRARGGFAALRACFDELPPEAVIDIIDRSGLRGRGGGGYPTGTKWRIVHGVAAARKFVICNGDEGDPGAFMDRMILESVPFRVIEGLAIAAWATGARDGIFYIRAEYPHAVERIRAAIAICEERGLLRHEGFELRLEVARGAGAFVCGEETALIASLEGRRGMPRLRPPYPAMSGLHGMPTLVNNTETLAMVPWIVRNGAEAFAALGTARSKGTKVFALAGKVARGGLVEVPMGMTIREIIDELGGGVAAGRTLKAVQIGGPSGGCVPASLADTPVDYESLLEVGAMMGSGGFVVLDDTDCMVDVARYFLHFTQTQSCGRCTPCRLGTRRLLEVLDRIRSGAGRAGDLELIEELAPHIRTNSLCGLGKSAPNPVLSTIRYFRDEYEAHLEGRCPAGRCQALISHVVTDACIGCTLCAQHCSTEAIPMNPYRKHEIDQARCNGCGVCKVVCPVDAVEVRARCPS
ncbi:MAG: NAD(P)H-dependent oxidoreductase subunit E [Planctomycetes bacterium]|nr:NAD(P)H-dependent oxidoreductase subunit E [Planctomycetota bacterium]